ncbi:MULTISPECIES: hypothetical protein [unclassified Mycobacterium]|jgi:hypothetical protein|uniref:hypothetical protein n=1 Tax=unclassified Mycobacterium TaxID=2642494 RepID=UPI0007FB82BA|nr:MULTISPECIES: hypothetical protein [unclassified Mycobacterium]OBB47688.1 hypothetical protein A5752_23160 [Mycobacterium sp. 852002-51961_SCH5331710]OBG92328.1 hypothetical protein A5698_19615 [Mycobacterium sp. E136]
MAIYEVSTIALAALLAAFATAAIYLGLLNWMGVFHVVRCAHCHHMTFSSTNRSPGSCVHCRHPALMHPIYAAHHQPPVRVVNDRLRY